SRRGRGGRDARTPCPPASSSRRRRRTATPDPRVEVVRTRSPVPSQPGALDILHRAVLLDAIANQPPRDALLAQDVVLRVDDEQCGVALVELHKLARCYCSRL